MLKSNQIAYRNLTLENVCVIMFTGVYRIMYPICLHSHGIHIHEARQTKHITVYTYRTVNNFLCKSPIIWNRTPITIQQNSNIKCFALSLKAIVVNGYGELAEAYPI